MSAPVPLKFRAFLSYSHADAKWGACLHKALERYPIDRDLVGRATRLGPVPKTLAPIFRDRDDFSGGHSLTEATLAALDASAALIVVCSPHAARSHYVNEEVRLFRWRHPGRQVIPVIIDGRPNAGLPLPLTGTGQGWGQAAGAEVAVTCPVSQPPPPLSQPPPPLSQPPPPTPPRKGEGSGAAAEEDECFPPALRFEVAADGTVTEMPVSLLAADVRDHADGKERALAKVVASLIDVPVDDVRKRQVMAEKGRLFRLAAVGTGLAALLMIAGFLWWQHERQQTREGELTRQMQAEREATRKELEEQRKQFQALAQRLSLIAPAQAGTGRERAVGEAIEAAAEAASKGDVRLQQALDLLGAGNVKAAEPLFRAVAEEKSARLAKDKREGAAAYRHLGAIAGMANPKRAREAYGKALELDPDDTESLYWHGYLHFLAGNLQMAEQSLSRLLPVATSRADQRGIYRAHLRLGEVAIERGSLPRAEEHQREALAIATAQAKAASDDLEWQRDLSVSQEKIGDVLRAQGNLPAALDAFQASLSIAERLAKSDPGNAGWQRDLSLSHSKIGDVLVEQGNLPAALDAFQASLSIAERLAKSDPGNAGWQRDLSVSHNKIGDVLRAQGNLPAALDAFQASHDIFERLAKSDPGNAGWQYDLGISNERLGDIHLAQGDLEKALSHYRAKNEIISRLAKSDPGNAVWQRDLSVSHIKIGDVLVEQGNLPAALDAFQASLAIAERRVAA